LAGRLAPAAVLGLVYGAVWWAVGTLWIMPANVGMPVFDWNDVTSSRLGAHLVFGLLELHCPCPNSASCVGSSFPAQRSVGFDTDAMAAALLMAEQKLPALLVLDEKGAPKYAVAHRLLCRGDRGRIYRGCGCRDTHRRQLGAHRPHLLTDSHHGTWTFAVDIPAPLHHRTTVRRGGFTSPDAAEAALRTFLEARPTDSTPTRTRPSPTTSTPGWRRRR